MSSYQDAMLKGMPGGGVDEDIDPIFEFLKTRAPKQAAKPRGRRPARKGKPDVFDQLVEKATKQRKPTELEALLEKYGRYGGVAGGPHIIPSAQIGVDHAGEKGPLSGLDTSKMSEKELKFAMGLFPKGGAEKWMKKRDALIAAQPEQMKENIKAKVDAWLNNYRHRERTGKSISAEDKQTFKDLQNKSVNDIYEILQGGNSD